MKNENCWVPIRNKIHFDFLGFDFDDNGDFITMPAGSDNWMEKLLFIEDYTKLVCCPKTPSSDFQIFKLKVKNSIFEDFLLKMSLSTLSS